MRVLKTVAGEKWRLHLVRVASGGYAWWERHRTVSVWVVGLGEIQTCGVRLADLSGGWAWGNGDCWTEQGKGGERTESKREKTNGWEMYLRGCKWGIMGNICLRELKLEEAGCKTKLSLFKESWCSLSKWCSLSNVVCLFRIFQKPTRKLHSQVQSWTLQNLWSDHSKIYTIKTLQNVCLLTFRV